MIIQSQSKSLAEYDGPIVVAVSYRQLDLKVSALFLVTVARTAIDWIPGRMDQSGHSSAYLSFCLCLFLSFFLSPSPPPPSLDWTIIQIIKRSLQDCRFLFYRWLLEKNPFWMGQSGGNDGGPPLRSAAVRKKIYQRYRSSRFSCFRPWCLRW